MQLEIFFNQRQLDSLLNRLSYIESAINGLREQMEAKEAKEQKGSPAPAQTSAYFSDSAYVHKGFVSLDKINRKIGGWCTPSFFRYLCKDNNVSPVSFSSGNRLYVTMADADRLMEVLKKMGGIVGKRKDKK